MTNLIYTNKSGTHGIDACLPQLSAAKEGKIQMNALTHGNYPGIPVSESFIPEISSMGFMDATGQQDWGMEEHRNEGIEICLQESGENILSVDGINYTMPSRTLSITRPWQLHRVGNPFLGPGRLHWIIIDVGVRRPNQKWQWPDWCILTQKDLDELTTILRGNEHPVWKADDELLRIFKRLAKYTLANEPESNASRIKVTINQLLIALLELLRSHRVATNAHLSSVARAVELFLEEIQRAPSNLSIPWTLSSMAEHCGLGRTAFSKYCYELKNVSPMEYLKKCRLDYAATRLRNEPEGSIIDIAMDSGFSTSQYFSNVFKSHFHMTPGQWRKQQRSTITGCNAPAAR